MQLTHTSHSKKEPTKQVILLCDNIVSPANQGAIFRLADSLGVQEIIFAGTKPDVHSSRLKKTARSTQEHVTHSFAEDPLDAIEKLHTQGYTSVGLEITTNSISIDQLAITITNIVLVVGNEQQGISEPLLGLMKVVTHITMQGHNSSMNVAQAAAIALYELTK